MKHYNKYTQFAKINPACKYPVWLVEISLTSTTNPMTYVRAIKIFNERRSDGKYAELIRTWSAISAEKFNYD